MKRPAHVQAFLTDHGEDARSIMWGWGIAASVVLGQSAVESSWGKSELCKHGVWFGTTAQSAGPNTVTRKLKQKDGTTKTWIYRTYPTYLDAARGYAENVRTFKPYVDSGAWPYRYSDPEEFLRRIGPSYHDSSYAGTVIGIMRDFNLKQYDALVLLEF